MSFNQTKSIIRTLSSNVDQFDAIVFRCGTQSIDRRKIYKCMTTGVTRHNQPVGYIIAIIGFRIQV